MYEKLQKIGTRMMIGILEDEKAASAAFLVLARPACW
ncbi:hypothetical protein BMMGA3_11525 [Bacillus methanolicus MGA3]|uniref:Uncharacterized protein n=1 Tax=Bacillus methanolicus (strain MGA3 / ATCC 53907) TaxID=796606 RepID=A0A068LSG1_BACMM|nr:hypothetical protein BMMGA3_11525 [Bacillus methanolicus MGA3]